MHTVVSVINVDMEVWNTIYSVNLVMKIPETVLGCLNIYMELCVLGHLFCFSSNLCRMVHRFACANKISIYWQCVLGVFDGHSGFLYRLLSVDACRYKRFSVVPICLLLVFLVIVLKGNVCVEAQRLMFRLCKSVF